MRNPSFLKPMSPTSLFNILGIPGTYCSPSCVLIDCRPISDYRKRHIRGAIHISPDATEIKKILADPSSTSTVPDIPDLPRAKKKSSDATTSSITALVAAAPPETAERVYELLWENFCRAYIGCYMPKTLILYTSDYSGEVERNKMVALSILLRNSRRGVLHDIAYLDKGFETFAKLFPFQCRCHETKRVFDGPFLLYPTQILPYVYLGSEKNSMSKKQIEQLGISYIVNCEGKTKHKLPMCAYFDLDLSQPKEPVAANFCTECGTRFRVPVKFCSECGERVLDRTLPKNTEEHLDFHRYVDIVDRCRRDARGAETGRNILLHCKTGNNLSAAVTIAFLMYLHRDLFRYHPRSANGQRYQSPHQSDASEKPWTLKRVLKFVRKHRPSVDVAGFLLRELARYEASLIQEARAGCVNVLPRKCTLSPPPPRGAPPAPASIPTRISSWKGWPRPSTTHIATPPRSAPRHRAVLVCAKVARTAAVTANKEENIEVEVKSFCNYKPKSILRRRDETKETDEKKNRNNEKTKKDRPPRSVTFALSSPVQFKSFRARQSTASFRNGRGSDYEAKEKDVGRFLDATRSMPMGERSSGSGIAETRRNCEAPNPGGTHWVPCRDPGTLGMAMPNSLQGSPPNPSF